MSTLTIYFLSISILMVVSILTIRVLAHRDYLQNGQLTIGSAVLQALLFFTYGGYPIIYLPSSWPETNVNLIFRVIGRISLLTGIIIMFIGIYRLGILRSFGLQTGELKETSYYLVSRNPQVLGCVLYVIGFFILWPSWYAMGWSVSLLVILHAMVLTEEEHLRNTFSQSYEEYCKNVLRYIGFPKKPEKDELVD